MFHSRWDNENQRCFPPTFRRVPNNIVLGFPEYIQRNTSSMSQNSKELSKKGAKKPETYSKHSLHALRAAITSSSVRMIVPGTACTVMLVEIAFAIRGIAAKWISCVRPFPAAIWAALALPLSLPLPLAEVSSDGNRSSKVFISRALLASHVVTFSVPALYCLYVSKRNGSIAILTKRLLYQDRPSNGGVRRKCDVPASVVESSSLIQGMDFKSWLESES